MCGIFGYTGRIHPSKWSIAHEFLTNLAIASEARGTDATGFAARWPKNRIAVDKQPKRASNFVRTSFKYNDLKRNMPTSLIGHTRLGTGSNPIIVNNNHPFLGKRFHMVHNGIIPSWKDIVDRHEVTLDSETDSELILRVIENQMSEGKKISSSVEWTLNKIWGNMAVALLDKRFPHIWLFRNENPLWVFKVPNHFFRCEMWVFSSTKGIFEEAWNKTFSKKTFKGVRATFLSDNQLYRMSTIAVNIGKGERHRLVYYPISVTNKFYRKTTYYGQIRGVASDVDGRYRANIAKNFYSKFVDVSSPEKGSEFNGRTRSKIKDHIDNKDTDAKTTFLDGLRLNEFVRLQDWITKFCKLEEKID